MQVQQLEDIFMHHWGKYCWGIVDFAEATKNKSKELKHALLEDDTPTKGICNKECDMAPLYIYTFVDNSDSLKAVRCLAHFLTPKSKKKACESSNLDVPYLIAEAPVSYQMGIVHVVLK